MQAFQFGRQIKPNLTTFTCPRIDDSGGLDAFNAMDWGGGVQSVSLKGNRQVTLDTHHPKSSRFEIKS